MFFCKQKTAYEMRSSDWSSDVCSSDLMPEGGILTVTVPGAVWGWDEVQRRFGALTFKETLQPAIDYAEPGFPISERIAHDWEQIGRASCRERAGQYGWISVDAVPLKKKI